KQRHGARVARVFDCPQTPYQRLRATGVLPPDQRDELEGLYHQLNPLQLQRDLDTALERLWTLAAPDPQRAAGNTEIATPLGKSSLGASQASASVTLTSGVDRQWRVTRTYELLRHGRVRADESLSASR